jgi:uncharacterized membrane protein YgcG
MFHIKVKVPTDRTRTAVVEFWSGRSRIAVGSAVASASAALAARHGNAGCDPLRPWGHPPFGSYQLLAQGPAPAGCEIEYGRQILVFQSMSGQALEAEAFGRLLLPAYAGPAGKAGRLRPTQGGLRLQQEQFDMLVGELKRDPEATLEIGALRPPWWQFWKAAAETAPFASEVPRLSAPPLDEASVATLIAGGKRLARRTPLQQDDWSDRDSGSTSDSSSRDTGYSGRGGEYGGAGASGGWDAPAAGGRGVDSSGRIVAAATGAALATAAIAASDAGGADASTDTSTDTQTATNY